MCKKPKEQIPDISEVDFDTRLRILLGEPPNREGADGDTAPSPVESTESDPDN